MPNGWRQCVKVVAPDGVNLILVALQPASSPLQRSIKRVREAPSAAPVPAMDLATAWSRHLGPRALASTQRLQRFTRLLDALIEGQVVSDQQQLSGFKFRRHFLEDALRVAWKSPCIIHPK